MTTKPLRASEATKLEQACKDANIALTLAIVSIYASPIPLLGMMLAFIAERLAYKIPNVKGISNIQTKENIVHILTPFSVILSALFLIIYYNQYNHRLF